MKDTSRMVYFDAIRDAHASPAAAQLLESLIDNYFDLNEQLKKTKLSDVLDYERRLVEPLRILAYENETLKKEVNQLRKKLNMGEKYKEINNENLG